jgi:hypothetical protein
MEDRALLACNPSAVPDGYTAGQGWRFPTLFPSCWKPEREKRIFLF